MMSRTISLLCAILTLTPVQALVAAETGKAMPNCTLTSMNDANSLGLKQYHGKVIYVDFWSSWCGPCAQSFAFLNELNKELKDQGLQIIGVNLDEVPEDAKTFLDAHPANFTVASDANQQCAKDFEVKAMPSSYLIDRHGIVRHVHLGFRPEEAKEFRVLAEQLLAEKP